MASNDINQLGSSNCRLLSGGEIINSSTSPGKGEDVGFENSLLWRNREVLHPLILSLLDENGDEIRLKSVLSRWRPGLLTTLYIANSVPHLQIETRKSITPQGVGVCEISFKYEGVQELSLHLIVWTQQLRLSSRSDTDYVQKSLDLISWEQRDSTDQDEHPFIAIGANRLPDSWLGLACEPVGELGNFETSGLPEQFSNGSLSRWFAPKASPHEVAWVTYALHYRIQLEKSTSDQITASFSINDSAEECEDGIRDSLFTNPFEQNESFWASYLSQLPSLLSSDSCLDATYRWRQILLNSYPSINSHTSNSAGQTNRQAPDDPFHSHSVCDSLRERCWLYNHSSLQSALIQLLKNHNPDIPNCLDYGRIAHQSYLITLDKKWGLNIFTELRTFTNLYLKTGRVERVLIDVENASNLYNNCIALEQLARILGETEEASHWAGRAFTISNTIRDMWDPVSSLFCNSDTNGVITRSTLLLTGYSPFSSGLGTLKHLPALDHLADPKHFGTPYPFPTISKDSKNYSALGLEGGIRRNNPANGVICPHEACLALEALAEVARSISSRFVPLAADKLHKFMELHFLNGDFGSPVSYDHYNPVTGKPSTYLGRDSVLKGYPLDLILRFLVGIIPSSEPDTITIHPLLSGLSRFNLQNLLYHNKRIDIQWNEETGLEVRVDGWLKGSTDQLERLEVTF